MQNIDVMRLADEPIIVVKASGHMTIEGLLEVYQRTAELRQDMPRNIYRITEFTEAQSSFTDMMSMMKEAIKRGGSSSTDPSVTVVFVGTTHWVTLFTDAMRQGAFGGKIIPVFESYDDALAYVRADITAKAVAN